MQRFGAVARVQIAGSSISKFMVNSPGANVKTAGVGIGRNPRTGIGSLRRVTARLARSIEGTTSEWGNESIFEVNVQGGNASVTMGSSTPYSGVHEYGFTGNVNIPAHTRTITQAFGRDIAPTTVNVRSHSRFMSIPERPYLEPAMKDQLRMLSGWLENEIVHAIENDRSTDFSG